MKEALYQNIPLIVASACLIAGALIGRSVAKTEFGYRMRLPAVILIVVAFIFSSAITSWLAGVLAGLVSVYAAKLIATGILSFVGGLLFTTFYNSSSKKPAE